MCGVGGGGGVGVGGVICRQRFLSNLLIIVHEPGI